MPLPRLIDAMTAAPARILGLEPGRLAPGAPADIVIADLNTKLDGRGSDLSSRSKNSPFEHRTLEGRVVETVVAGRTVYAYDSPHANARRRLAMSLGDPLALLLGYLCGSIPFGLLLTRLAGLGDVRSIGSGNIGATNVLRTGSKKIAALTLILDALKGAAPVLICRRAVGLDGGDCRRACGLCRPRLSRLAEVPRRQGRGHLHRHAVRLVVAAGAVLSRRVARRGARLADFLACRTCRERRCGAAGFRATRRALSGLPALS